MIGNAPAFLIIIALVAIIFCGYALKPWLEEGADYLAAALRRRRRGRSRHRFTKGNL